MSAAVGERTLVRLRPSREVVVSSHRGPIIRGLVRRLRQGPRRRWTNNCICNEI